MMGYQGRSRWNGPFIWIAQFGSIWEWHGLSNYILHKLLYVFCWIKRWVLCSKKKKMYSVTSPQFFFCILFPKKKLICAFLTKRTWHSSTKQKRSYSRIKNTMAQRSTKIWLYERNNICSSSWIDAWTSKRSLAAFSEVNRDVDVCFGKEIIQVEPIIPS